RVQLAMLFFEKKHRSAWFGKSDTDVCWEQWLLTVTVTWPITEKDRSRDRATSSSSLRQALGEVLRLCEEHRDHVPIITTSDVNPFPFQISLPGGGDSWG
ncbi:MAG: autophagy-related protein, partial [Piptocephalis tieghemiana]